MLYHLDLLLYFNTDTMGDSLDNFENVKKMENLRADYEIGKKQQKIDLLEKDKKLKDQELKLKQEETKIQRLISLGLTVVLILAFALTYLIFRGRQKAKLNNLVLNAQKTELEDKNRLLKEQSEAMLVQNEELQQTQEEIVAQREFITERNKELEFSNKQIQKSITAALSIQQAILPPKAKIDALLKEYFVLYQPKDVVSGDFYWIHQEGNKTVIVVADCTGHGVPGAFMTLIGSVLLDRIVKIRQITSPAEILNNMHVEIQQLLRQEELGNNNGMDAIVITLQTLDIYQNTKILFSGAKNNLYYVLPHTNDVQILEADRKSIGGEQTKIIEFTNQSLILPIKSMLYLGSDGLKDQNNSQRKKIGQTKLAEILASICSKPIKEQKQYMEDFLHDYMLGTHQRDDILWMGIKI
jgi:serine phosphatase RsbU (regulator of sigma subunit)